MAVHVPFHLRRRDDPLPANGLLIETDEPAPLLAVCSRLPDPLIFRVAVGYLVIADSIPPQGFAGVRMRRLSENCYLPADADLIPPLMPAEAIDLTKSRGLVFRPGHDPLAFDTTNPLSPAAFLGVRRPIREDWEPFPTGTPLADRLHSITRLVEIPPLDDLLREGDSVGTEEERPPQVGPGRRALGKLSSGLGKGIGAMGRAFGSKKLKELGEKLKAKAAKIAPRISEELLGRQEAALQHLLKKFREGKTDDALRNSIPIGGEETRGNQIYNGAQLPQQGLNWSLAGLFSGGGSGTVWVGGNPETWRNLWAEYHKAAREAADRGDFRRAALIYAKLLNDFRAAAEVLARGGLHREAGIIFRDKAKQFERAAQEFEKAGEFDEALRLYRDASQFEASGDLLRRMGEEERAIEEYHQAAKRKIESKQDYVAAGDLLLKKTGRADLAGAYFLRGWQSRSDSLAYARNALPCAERLIEIYAFAEPRDPFWQLFDEAENWLAEPGWSHDSSRFFNKVTGLAELPHLKLERGEIRDRCRLGLSTKLRQSSTTEVNVGTNVSDLLSTSKLWSPAVVSDADFAFRAAIKERPRTEPQNPQAVTLQKLHASTVTAAVQAPNSEEIRLGFRDGVVLRFLPATSETIRMESDLFEVRGLATDETGDSLVALLVIGMPMSTSDHFKLQLWQRKFDASWSRTASSQFTAREGSVSGLLPLLEGYYGAGSLGVNMAEGLAWYTLPELVPRIESSASTPPSPTTHLRLRIPERGESNVLSFQGGTVSWGGHRAFVGWTPHDAEASTLHTPALSWLVTSSIHVELVGLFDSAVLYWTELDRTAEHLNQRTLNVRAPNGFRAVAAWRAGMVAGVTSANQVFWLRARSGRMEVFAPHVDIPATSHAAACFASRKTNELLVVLEDGTLVRVPAPT